MLHADLIVTNGRIATLDAGDRIVEALAARDGVIVATGNALDMARLAGPRTREIDLDGRRAIPGIIDSHCHPDSHAARIARWNDLSPTQVDSRPALLDLIDRRSRTLAPGEWFVGYRFNENKSGGYPDIGELDRVTHGHPLFILRTDGHMGLVNSSAFRDRGIDADSADPPFGRFDHDPRTGALTGLVRESAAHLFLDRIKAADSTEEVARGLVDVFDEFLSHGVTSVYNSLTGSTGIQAYQFMRERDWLELRVGIIVSGREEGLVDAYIRAGIRSGFGDDRVRIIGVEWCPDCSTSGRTAAYYAPYQGVPAPGEPQGNTGMLLHDAHDLRSRAIAAHRAGLQVMIEGVGDRGIDFALDAIEAALEAHPKADHRMRVEHCCCVTPPILERLKRLGAVDSSATGFMYELGDAYRANRGAKAMRWMWPHRTLIDAGVPAPGHSDAFVCTPNPFAAMWAMVNRKTDSGQSLDTAEAVTPLEALRAYTTLAAYSGREEHIKGSLEPGKLADIAVLDRDLLTIAPDSIRDVRADMTIVGGKIAYCR